MSDDDGCAAFHELRQRLLNELFAFGIDLAGRFVENEYIGISQNGAGQHDALFLPAGQSTTPRADIRLVAILQYGCNELVRVGSLTGLDDLFVCGFRLSITNVFYHRTTKQRRVLGYDAYSATQFGLPHVANIGVSKSHAAFVRIVES